MRFLTNCILHGVLKIVPPGAQVKEVSSWLDAPSGWGALQCVSSGNAALPVMRTPCEVPDKCMGCHRRKCMFVIASVGGA